MDYRIPNIEEFIQGFEFEYYDNTSYRMVMLDFSPGGKVTDLTPSKEIGWSKRIVDWKHLPNERIIEPFKDYSGKDCILEYRGDTANFFSPFYRIDIQQLIDKGKIRCKK